MAGVCHTRLVRTKRLRHFALAASSVVLISTACGNDEPRASAAQFCAELAANSSLVISPPLANQLDVTAVIDLYARLNQLAPLAISQEWATLFHAVETASTVVPNDADGLQRVVQAAYESEGAAVRISEWVLASCGIDLGPVTTIVPHDAAEPATPVGAVEN